MPCDCSVSCSCEPKCSCDPAECKCDCCKPSKSCLKCKEKDCECKPVAETPDGEESKNGDECKESGSDKPISLTCEVITINVPESCKCTQCECTLGMHCGDNLCRKGNIYDKNSETIAVVESSDAEKSDTQTESTLDSSSLNVSCKMDAPRTPVECPCAACPCVNSEACCEGKCPRKNENDSFEKVPEQKSGDGEMDEKTDATIPKLAEIAEAACPNLITASDATQSPDVTPDSEPPSCCPYTAKYGTNALAPSELPIVEIVKNAIRESGERLAKIIADGIEPTPIPHLKKPVYVEEELIGEHGSSSKKTEIKEKDADSPEKTEVGAQKDVAAS